MTKEYFEKWRLFLISRCENIRENPTYEHYLTLSSWDKAVISGIIRKEALARENESLY